MALWTLSCRRRTCQNAIPPLKVHATLGLLSQEILVIIRNISCYLNVLILLHHNVVGKDLVNGHSFCVRPRISYKCKPRWVKWMPAEAWLKMWHRYGKVPQNPNLPSLD